jgi:RNA polymerase sigma factor (sigma-70 family)
VTTRRTSNQIGPLLRAASGMEFEGLSDGQLLEAFHRRRDEAAFAALVRRHGPMVLGVCRRVLGNRDDADDAFQATFLVLVRKAGTLSSRAVLGDWLHGVARNVSLKLRTAAARRRAKERAAARPALETAGVSTAWGWILDEALSRLPEKYRLPIVLCDLEGRTRSEAAAQLRWPEGTVAGRLARGRALLARRLLRGAAGSAGLLPASAAPAALPPETVQATVQAAASLAGPTTPAQGVPSARALSLAQGVIRTMRWHRLKRIVMTLLLAVTALGLGAFALHVLADQAPVNQPVRDVQGPPAPEVQVPPAGKDAPRDASLIRGVWQVIHAEVLGKHTREASDKQIWQIAPGKIVVHYDDGDKDDEWTFRLDPSVTPHAIDLKKTVGVKAGATAAGVYQFHGNDVLHLCFNGDGKRPDRLALVDVGDSRWAAFYVLKRVRPPVDVTRPIEGVQLTLTPKSGKTVMKADGSTIEPIALTVTFTNVGKQPLRVDVWDFPWRNFLVEATGPDAHSVTMKATSFTRMKVFPPGPEDFPLLQPGQSWSSTLSVDVAGNFLDNLLALRQPGRYRLTLVYTNAQAMDLGFAESVGVGTLRSNEMVLDVLPAR